MANLTVQEITELRDELIRARSLGAKRVRFRERDVTYRTDDEMRRIIDDLNSQLETAADGRPTVTFASFDSGL
jgi:hypothetical protein